MGFLVIAYRLYDVIINLAMKISKKICFIVEKFEFFQIRFKS